MKIYKFYLKHDFKDIFHDIEDEYTMRDEHKILYAMTENKKYKKQFEKERDMDAFKLKVEHIDEDDFYELRQEEQSKFLDEYELDGQDKDGNKYTMKLCCTEYEYISITDECDDFLMSMMGQPVVSISVFNDEVYKALTALKYTDYYHIRGTFQEYDTKYASNHEDFTIPDDYDFDLPQTDLVSMFVAMFGSTLKK